MSARVSVSPSEISQAEARGRWRQKKGLSDTLLNSANEPLTSGDRDGVAALALTCRALRDAAHLRSLKRHVSGLRLLLLQLALLR